MSLGFEAAFSCRPIAMSDPSPVPKDKGSRPLPSSSFASSRMRRTPSRDTRPEIRLRSALHRLGLRFRVDARPLLGVRRRADVVFRSVRVAVFLDGCFWHGCDVHCVWPKANAKWWREKIERNRRRDVDTDRRLTEAGWTSIRVWEHDPVDVAASRIEKLVRRRKASLTR